MDQPALHGYFSSHLENFTVGHLPGRNYISFVPENLQPPESPPRVWADVKLPHLRHNLSVVREFQPESSVMAVLKAGAYGHGIVEIASYLETLPAGEAPEFFGVASVIEARKLHQAGLNTRIYLLGPTCPAERAEVVAMGWTPCISTVDEAREFDSLNEGNKKLAVHIAVDTGMGRGGFLPDDLLKNFNLLGKLPFLEIEGIGSHLPSADEDEQFTRGQFDVFDSLVEQLGVDKFRYRHLSNSAGIIGYQSRCTNLCRPGLMLYGISPIPSAQEKLKPVLSLLSHVSLVRSLPQGHGISYGRGTVLEKETRVATIGIGYGDGYPRSVSLKGAAVCIAGMRCPLLGRVTMDQIMVDVSELTSCTPSERAEVFGGEILVSEVAEWAELIPWEILTGITPRVKRVYR